MPVRLEDIRHYIRLLILLLVGLPMSLTMDMDRPTPEDTEEALRLRMTSAGDLILETKAFSLTCSSDPSQEQCTTLFTTEILDHTERTP